MHFLLILFFVVPVMAAESEVARVAREVKERKALLLEFRKKVTNGDKCRPRDYACFREEIFNFSHGQTEDIIEAKLLLEPFYLRSLKEGFPPCSESCQETMKVNYVELFLIILGNYDTSNEKTYRLDVYPTVAATKIRAYMDLSALQRIWLYTSELAQIIEGMKDKEKEKYDPALITIRAGKRFSHSVLCNLQKGDIVYDEIMGKENSGKKMDKEYAETLKLFEKKVIKRCENREPLDYRGTDASTRHHYNAIRDRKIAAIDCAKNDFACVRKNFRKIPIRYAEDIGKVAAFMKTFVKNSRPDQCDDSCEARLLVRTIQTWITYFSTFHRQRLGSTMDWEKYPEARFQTLTEDVLFYRALKEIFDPFLLALGKIDPKGLKDEGLKSELRSIGKDVSDFASARMLKDSVICTMTPWNASYDKYMLPYEDKAENKKFETTFLEFKENICK